MKTLLTVSVAILFAFSAQNQFVSKAQHSSQLTEMGEASAVRQADAEVAEKYEEISRLNIAQRKHLYFTLPVKMQENLWSKHLQKILAEHPDLTNDQRSVLFEGISILASSIIENRRSHPELDTAFNATIKHLEHRAKAILPPELAKSAFFELGGPAAPHEGNQVRIYGFLDNCDCSSQSNWCDWVTNPTPNCKGRCRATHGCGTFWEYDCDGLCSS